MTLKSMSNILLHIVMPNYGAVGWSGVCECGIPWSSLVFFTYIYIVKT